MHYILYITKISCTECHHSVQLFVSVPSYTR
nr:MAG TPA: hypothetical protein [Caudoviricetes sp.]